MCGLVGLVGPGVATDRLSDMRDVLTHRGPDDSGVYEGDGVALGFRRLSIIDVCTGHQPLSNEDRTVWVVLNGEIYNFRELRRDLESRGHRFATLSDTECLVHGYEEFGESVFSRLNGMFAVALWDSTRRRLLLARDRAGEKPLHYFVGPGGLIFASEMKALLKHASVSREIDWAALDEFMSFGYIAAPRSIFRDIRKLLPGHYLVWEQGRSRIHRYWSIDLTKRFTGSVEDAREECIRLLDDAVHLRMISEVPLGAFLSGGIDSSAVVAFMARNSPSPVRTFSIGFDETGYDETMYADLVAKRYGTDNTKLIITPQYQGDIERILLNFDEPFGDSSALPTYLVSFLTRQHVTVALSGDGGDELFGGYITYRMLERFAALMRVVPGALKALAGAMANMLPVDTRLERRLRYVGLPENDRFVRMVTHFKATDKEELYSQHTKSAIEEERSLPCAKTQLMHQENVAYTDRMQFVDFMQYLPDDILVKVDRTSMLVSLETRAPFLDHRLVEFAFSLPPRWKVSSQGSKIILKDALRDVLPAEIVGRGKMGFSVPVREWFAGPLYEFCRSRIMESSLGRFFNRNAIGALLEEHQRRRRDNSTKLWLLLCFSLWASRNT